MISKGYKISLQCRINCLKTLKKNMISFVTNLGHVIANVCADDFNKGKRLFDQVMHCGDFINAKKISTFIVKTSIL